MPTRRLAAAVFAISLSGCIVDGWTQVRGSIYREEMGARVPLEGAVVSVQERQVVQERVTTGGDGRYAARYLFGGMHLLFIPLAATRQDEGFLLITADGYRPLRFGIEQKGLPPSVNRRRCAEDHRGCYEIDAVLSTEAPAPE